MAEITIDPEQMKHDVIADGRVAGVLHWHRDVYGGTLHMGTGWYPIPHGEDLEAVENLVRKAFDETRISDEIETLKGLFADVRSLQEERTSCCDQKRHMQLTMPGGIIQQAENARDLQRFVCSVKIAAMTGCSMQDLRDLLGGY